MPDKELPKRRGRPPGKPSVESRVIDACGKHWQAKSNKHLALKGIRIPEAGAIELLLLGPSEGALIVIARTWPHAAAFAHVVGQAIGEVAHMMNGASAGGRALLEGSELDPQAARKLGARLVSDAAAGKLGIVFAIGFTDAEGDEPVRRRLVPVLTLLDRWAEQGSSGLTMGIHLWSVRLGEDENDAKVELTPLRPPKARTKG
jgi:hypothetical protein